jgi:plastocyanin
VSVVDNAFNPSCAQVTPGSIVTWTFNGTGHNVTFSNSSLGGSGNQSPGATYTKTFPTAGTFTYSCTNHAGMTGSVLVQ